MGVAIGSCNNFIRDSFVGFSQFGIFPANITFGGEDGIGGVGDGLALGGLANDTLAAFGEGDHGGGGAGTFAVFEDGGDAAFHDCHAGVGGAEVDAENFSH